MNEIMGLTGEERNVVFEALRLLRLKAIEDGDTAKAKLVSYVGETLATAGF